MSGVPPFVSLPSVQVALAESTQGHRKAAMAHGQRRGRNTPGLGVENNRNQQIC